MFQSAPALVRAGDLSMQGDEGAGRVSIRAGSRESRRPGWLAGKSEGRRFQSAPALVRAGDAAWVCAGRRYCSFNPRRLS